MSGSKPISLNVAPALTPMHMSFLYSPIWALALANKQKNKVRNINFFTYVEEIERILMVKIGIKSFL